MSLFIHSLYTFVFSCYIDSWVWDNVIVDPGEIISVTMWTKEKADDPSLHCILNQEDWSQVPLCNRSSYVENHFNMIGYDIVRRDDGYLGVKYTLQVLAIDSFEMCSDVFLNKGILFPHFRVLVNNLVKGQMNHERFDRPFLFLKTHKNQGFHWWVISLIIFIIFFVLSLFYISRKNNNILKTPYDQLLLDIHDESFGKDGYEKLLFAFKRYLTHRFGISFLTIPHRIFGEKLQGCGLSPDIIDHILRLINEMTAVKFSSVENRDDLFPSDNIIYIAKLCEDNYS